MRYKELSPAQRGARLADNRLGGEPYKGGARLAATKGEEAWYVVKRDGRKSEEEVSHHLAGLGHEVLLRGRDTRLPGYTILLSRDPGHDAISIEATPGVASILKKAPHDDRERRAAPITDDEFKRLGETPPPTAAAPVEAEPPALPLDGPAQLAERRRLKRSNDSCRRAQQRALKAKFQQAA